MNTGNEWLQAALAFDSSSSGQGSSSSDNDFLIAHTYDVFGEALPHSPNSLRYAMDVLNWLTGFLVILALVFSILVADIWAGVLFLTYLCHWVASVVVSYRPLVSVYQPSIKSRNPLNRAQTNNLAHAPPSHATVPENGEALFSIHERDEGGTIIFKGRRDTIEAWARIGWSYNTEHNLTHWIWIITGTLAAIASVACMVNSKSLLLLSFHGCAETYFVIYPVVIHNQIIKSTIPSLCFNSTKPNLSLANDPKLGAQSMPTQDYYSVRRSPTRLPRHPRLLLPGRNPRHTNSRSSPAPKPTARSTFPSRT